MKSLGEKVVITNITTNNDLNINESTVMIIIIVKMFPWRRQQEKQLHVMLCCRRNHQYKKGHPFYLLVSINKIFFNWTVMINITNHHFQGVTICVKMCFNWIEKVVKNKSDKLYTKSQIILKNYYWKERKSCYEELSCNQTIHSVVHSVFQLRIYRKKRGKIC